MVLFMTASAIVLCGTTTLDTLVKWIHLPAQKATIHLVTTVLATSKNALFQVITTMLTTGRPTDDQHFDYCPSANEVDT